MVLTITNHDRDAQGLTYVYAVVSRRSRGVSLGINLNPNNACNWRCIYCQVPNLQRGAAPEIDLDKLDAELGALLDDILHGDWLTREAPPEARRLNDIAISGNGEPTSSSVFDRVITRIGAAMRARDLVGRVKLVLITNGSLIHRELVQRGLTEMAALGGEVWFKLDAGSMAERERINGTRLSNEHVERNLALAAACCPTKIQTCVVAIDGHGPSEQARRDYVELLGRVLARGTRLDGVMLYGLARASMQPEAARLSKLDADALERFADEIRTLGLDVSVHA